MTESRLNANRVTLSYGDETIVHELDLTIPDGEITTIIGPNGCGKSTLLRALSRLKQPNGGTVILDGQSIHHLPTRDVAKRLGLLAQQSLPPGGIMVEDLVRRGRYPHQALLQPPTANDEAAVDRAIELAGMNDLRRRQVDELSGGQRQRAWIAMVLAQETPLLLLDEPTTYLDLSHQMQVIDLVQRLNANENRTVVMVLHDLNEAARVSHRIVAMRAGKLLREGTPAEVIEPQLLSELYGIRCDVYTNAAIDRPFCLPRGEAPLPTAPAEAKRLFEIADLETGYGEVAILRRLTVSIPSGAITAVIGPNACGKSTLLRTCGRMLRQSSGTVRLDGDEVHRGRHKTLARKLAMLGQSSIAPAGLVVEDLVAAGRIPHQGLLRQWRKEDEEMVETALALSRLSEMRDRPVETLSGGQRQRAWFGMALAQDTPVLLLDEPTTFLDLAAQIELLDIVRELNHEHGRSIVMVLHDLNLAARYADHIVAMKNGEIVATGTPAEVITIELLRSVFEIEATVHPDPVTGTPLVMPIRAADEILPETSIL